MDLEWLHNGPGIVIVCGLGLDVAGFVLLLVTTTYSWIRREIDIDRVYRELNDQDRKAVIFPGNNLATVKDTISVDERKWMDSESRETKWNRRRRWTAVGMILFGFICQICGQVWSLLG